MELCNSDQWGTVCDDFWEASDTVVVCRQLGFSTSGLFKLQLQSPLLISRNMFLGPTGVSFAAFGTGMGPIWLDNVLCVGTESRLIDCPAHAIGSYNCVHSEDAGVRCGTGTVTGKHTDIKAILGSRAFHCALYLEPDSVRTRVP